MDSMFQVRTILQANIWNILICDPASHKYTLLQTEEDIYVPDMSSNANRMEVRKNWDKLMPRKYLYSFAVSQANISIVGSGSVAIPDYKKYPMLGEPISDDPIRSGPIFEASWTHALHCVCPKSLIWPF